MIMKKHRSHLVSLAASCAALLAILVSFERPAQAYVDPGSGALIWQGMLATLVGLAFYFRKALGWAKKKVFPSKTVDDRNTRAAGNW